MLNGETAENALVLIACVRAAIINKCKHYNSSGKLLETEAEIIECLRSEKNVTIDESKREQITTAYIELEKARKQYGPFIASKKGEPNAERGEKV